jgi:hypothetical protein
VNAIASGGARSISIPNQTRCPCEAAVIRYHSERVRRIRRVAGWTVVAALTGLLATFLLPQRRLERALEKALTRDLEIVEAWAGVAPPRPSYRPPKIERAALPILFRWLAEEEPRPPLLHRIAAQIPMPDRLRTATTEFVGMDDSYLNIRPTPHELAARGFALLGATGAPAPPEIARLARDAETIHAPAVAALIYMGSVALPVALEFARSQEPRQRVTGAYIIGALARNTEECVPLLRRLVMDDHPDVRKEALMALGVFPRREVEPEILALLQDNGAALEAAYAIHGYGTNAVPIYLDCLASTQRNTRVAAMAGLSFREFMPKVPDAKVNRHINYIGKRSIFRSIGLSMAWRLYANDDDEGVFDTIRSNYQASGNAKFNETLHRQTLHHHAQERRGASK